MTTLVETLARPSCSIATLILLGSPLPLPAQEDGPVLYVANNAVHNGPSCGTPDRPCRSISQAIENAADGNLIEVGPGIYGDIDGDGDASSPGEEPGLVINKALTLYSKAGAAQTIIRAPRRPDLRTIVVLIHVDNTTFGRPNSGFTIVGDTSEVGEGSEGITVSGPTGNVTIADNIVMDNSAGGVIVVAPQQRATGEIVVRRNVATRNDGGFVVDEANFPVGRVRLEENIAADNVRAGFLLGESAHEPRRGDAHVVINNLATRNQTGFRLVGGGNTIAGNLAVANRQFGIQSCAHSTDACGLLSRPPNPSAPGNELIRNTIIGNAIAGLRFHPGTRDLSLRENNIFGNGDGAFGCGLLNESGSIVDAALNYWGAPAGPGPNPADRAHKTCEGPGSSTITTPFSAAPFSSAQQSAAVSN